MRARREALEALERVGGSTNLVDLARYGIEHEVAAAACRVAALERELDAMKLAVADKGIEVVAARLELRTAVAALEGHDTMRDRGGWGE